MSDNKDGKLKDKLYTDGPDLYEHTAICASIFQHPSAFLPWFVVTVPWARSSWQV